MEIQHTKWLGTRNLAARARYCKSLKIEIQLLFILLFPGVFSFQIWQLKNNWKNTKLCESHLVHWDMSQPKFNVLGCFVPELLGFIFYIYTIFICSFADFDKNGKNNWRNTKLCESHLDYLNNSQPMFECCKLIHFVVKTLL